MKKTTTLKQGLKSLLKDDLLVIAENQRIKFPSNMKKNDMINVLSEILPTNFGEDLIYFSPNELMIYSGGFKEIFKGIDFDTIRDAVQNEQEQFDIPDMIDATGKNISLEEVFDSVDVLQKSLTEYDVDELNRLIAYGYLFASEKDNIPTFQVPSELQAVLTKKLETNKDELFDYQSLQTLLISLTNLYGVCSYHQLHKVFKHFNGSTLSLKKVRDYCLKYSENNYFIEAEDHYLYNSMLKPEDFEIIVDSDLKRDYYFPNEEDLKAYGYNVFSPQGLEIFKDLMEFILYHSKTEDILNDECLSYEEALKMGNNEVVKIYDDILDEILFCAKMGYGLYDFIKILNKSFFKFDSLPSMNAAYSTYLELLENTRKWPLKGFLYSEL